MHFLESLVSSHKCVEELPRRRVACVQVRVEKKGRKPFLTILEGPIFVLKIDAPMILVPSDVPVFSDDGDVLEGDFAVTTESFDPIHVLVELKGPVFEDAFPMLFHSAKSRRSTSK
jgi:hypothetical protein